MPGLKTKAVTKNHSLSKKTALFLSSAITSVFVLLVRAYQILFSPLLPASCRFHPSCSQYAIESFQKHSFLTAINLSIKRITRCHPFHKGGYDPVP